MVSQSSEITHASTYYPKFLGLVFLFTPALGGAELKWQQFQSAQVPSQLAPRSGQVRSGQVRVFNVHIQSKLLKRTLVTGTGTFAVSSVRVREKRWREWGGGGGKGAPALAGTR